MFHEWSSNTPVILVPIHQQIWLVAAIFDFNYRILSQYYLAVRQVLLALNARKSRSILKNRSKNFVILVAENILELKTKDRFMYWAISEMETQNLVAE